MDFLFVLHYEITTLKFLLLDLRRGLLVVFDVTLSLHLVLLNLDGFAHADV